MFIHKKTFIYTFSISQAHILSVEKNNIDSAKKVEISVSHFLTHKGKDEDKTNFWPILASDELGMYE